MKSKIAKSLSVVVITLLLTGCKAQTEELPASETSDAHQNEEHLVETESAVSDNTIVYKEKTRTEDSLISEDEAKDIALKKAELKED